MHQSLLWLYFICQRGSRFCLRAPHFFVFLGGTRKQNQFIPEICLGKSWRISLVYTHLNGCESTILYRKGHLPDWSSENLVNALILHPGIYMQCIHVLSNETLTLTHWNNTSISISNICIVLFRNLSWSFHVRHNVYYVQAATGSSNQTHQCSFKQ